MSGTMTASYVAPQSYTFEYDKEKENWVHQPMMHPDLNTDQLEGLVEQAKIEQAKKEAEEVKEKGVVIIRYTIVDPNKVLADKKPESVVLKQGLMARPKWDERSFLMEMGGEIRDLLEGHNGIRTEIQYENDKGDLVFLKEAKLADLDVVVEVIKQYE